MVETYEIREVGEGQTVYAAYTGAVIHTLRPSQYNNHAYGYFEEDGFTITNPRFSVIERVTD